MPVLPCLCLFFAMLLAMAPAMSIGQHNDTMAERYNYSDAFLNTRPPQTSHSWAYIDTLQWMKGRAWDEKSIRDSFPALNYGQLKNLSRKVLAGEPLTIVTYGDSVTASYSGCYPITQNASSSSHPNQFFFKATRLEPWDGELCDRIPNLPWMTSFLTLLNHTYPSRQPHRYINFGSSAATLLGHAENDCQSDFLPDQIDLCIVQHFSMLEDPKKLALYAETHLHRLWLHNKAGPVPVIYLNLFGFSQGNRASNPMEIAVDKCLRTSGRWSAVTTCSTDCDPHGFFIGEPKTSNATETAEAEAHRVAKHYGLASWSQKALIAALLADKVHTRHNLTSCELFSQLYIDPFHPKEGGRILLADVLFHYISTGIELYKKDGLSAAAPIHNIASPLVPESMLVPMIHCFQAKPMALTLDDKVSQAMDIVKADGWSLIELDGPKKAYKPGWISETPGSRLWVKVPLSHHQHNGHLHIVVTYLVSYQSMGKARISCVESCSCQPQIIDALSNITSWSFGCGHHIDASLTSGSNSCTIQVEVIQAEDKRDRQKFKIISLQSTARLNMSSTFQVQASLGR
jgi:hypothetical protein